MYYSLSKRLKPSYFTISHGLTLQLQYEYGSTSNFKTLNSFGYVLVMTNLGYFLLQQQKIRFQKQKRVPMFHRALYNDRRGCLLFQEGDDNIDVNVDKMSWAVCYYAKLGREQFHALLLRWLAIKLKTVCFTSKIRFTIIKLPFRVFIM